MCGPCKHTHAHPFCATVMHRFFTSPVSSISSPGCPEKDGDVEGESLSLRKCILSQVDVYIIFECVFSIRTPRGFLQAEIGHKSSFQQFHRLRHTCKEVVVRHEDSLSINLTVSWPATKLGSLHYFFCLPCRCIQSIL